MKPADLHAVIGPDFHRLFAGIPKPEAPMPYVTIPADLPPERDPGAADVLAANPTTEESSVVPALQRYIATRDRRVLKSSGWDRNAISGMFETLLERGVVTVGGRASCGPSIDPSWVSFSAWREVVRKAQSLGYEIEETSIKQKNAWATKAGGFWDESEFRLISTPSARATGAES